ncbi:hypothetical protein SUGI_1497940 [Cryptomeria japonica]|uniref:Uncharacterized protein n=1 Tax=Cryptomeria japonica TaxID=3369 RepID=A0AAD3NNX1_CRYJA|nr:hypothetical protein SUGI_1497940 [Cryptomeria japonica]
MFIDGEPWATHAANCGVKESTRLLRTSLMRAMVAGRSSYGDICRTDTGLHPHSGTGLNSKQSSSAPTAHALLF